MMRATLTATLLATLFGCAATPRFRDQAIVWRVDDSRDIPEPEERSFEPLAAFADMIALRRLTRTLEIRDSEPAHNTNALDEVPDSTWFTNRIGARTITPEEAARGPSLGAPRLPLTVVAGKGGGANPGFFAKDAVGDTFLIKFDTKDNPEMQTATGLIVNRIFWAVGYNVPDDTVFLLRREDIKIAEGATYKDELKRKIPLTDEVIEAHLATSPRRTDGSYRVSASRFLPGKPKGGWPAEGVRADDSNDLVPHEHRRELRGLRVFSAWVGHTDMKEDNSLDMYVEEDGRHFLRHYLVDFGEALGSHQAEKGIYADGFEYFFDWRNQMLALLAFGLWKRPWEDQEQTPWPVVGAFSAEHFEPELWREVYPYWPFFETDAADLYWGAKLVMRFDRPMIERIVDASQISNADARAYLVDALMGRRKKIGHAWLEPLTSLDYFRVIDDRLCAYDLGMLYGLATEGVVERLTAEYDPAFDDEKIEPSDPVESFRVADDGHVCWPLDTKRDYSVQRLRLRRGGDRRPVMQVHIAGGTKPRIVGIVRVER